MSSKIKINQVSGDKDKDKLKDCYFLPTATAGYYNFYDKCGGLVASNVSSGNNFSFTIDPYNWTITNFTISGTASDGSASGNWSNNDSSPANDTGSFQAQAGDVEDAEESSASAGA